MSGQKKYSCIKPLTVPRYDEDGYWMGGQPIEIQKGTELVAGGPLFLAVPPAVRLSGPDGLWVEIHPDTLRRHFQEV